MKTTAPAVITHEFTDNDEPAAERRPFRSHGATVAEARDRMSGPPSRWTYTGKSTRTPYVHHERAAAIAAALPAAIAEIHETPPGAAWTARPTSDEYPDASFELVRADGLTLHMSAPGKYDRAETAFKFSLSAPRRAGCYVEAYGPPEPGKGCPRITSPTIGTAATKTPEQMARDIARRLLPLAEIHHAATVARIASLDAADNAQHQSAQQMAAAFAQELTTDYHTKKPATLGSFGPLDWQAHEGGSVDLKARSLPLPVAAAIARAIAPILADFILANK